MFTELEDYLREIKEKVSSEMDFGNGKEKECPMQFANEMGELMIVFK